MTTKALLQKACCNDTHIAFVDCDSPLGMQSGDIPNSDITASSEVSSQTLLGIFNYREKLFFFLEGQVDEGTYMPNPWRLATRKAVT